MRIPMIRFAAIASASLALALGSAAPRAQTFSDNEGSLKSCKAANVGLRDLAINAQGSGVRSFYEGAALVLQVDQIEPAAASAGIVVLLIDPQSELGDRNCYAATGFNGLNLDNAKSSYAPSTGVTLRIPAMNYDAETGTSKPGRALVLTINAATGTVTATR